MITSFGEFVTYTNNFIRNQPSNSSGANTSNSRSISKDLESYRQSEKVTHVPSSSCMSEVYIHVY
jgi:hypothetical protein